MEINAVRELIAADMQAVDQLILESLHSDVALVNQIGHYIVNSGGKRLRPMIVLLAARALGYTGERHVDLAAIVEFIHTATLLHDDVVDGSEQRRSRDTANAVWGNAASVLVGDFLYSRSFEMMVAVESMRVMEILSHATNRIAEGEVLQLLNCHDAETDEARYREVILRKTATLFEAGARLGAVIAGGAPEEEQGMADYGRHLGMAFQMVDDALDYSASSVQMGKNLGDDLAEGKPTLPLIHALRQSAGEDSEVIRKAIENGGLDQLERILAIIEHTGAIPYTARLANEEADHARRALEAIPPSSFSSALAALTDFATNRTS